MSDPDTAAGGGDTPPGDRVITLAADRETLAASLLGAAAGMRTLTPAAVLAVRGRLGADPRIRNAVAAAAAVELLTDKLPFTPARTRWFSYLARLASAALCGRIVAGTSGAASAAAACAVSTQAGYRARIAARGKLRGALIEDALAVTSATLGSRLARFARPDTW